MASERRAQLATLCGKLANGVVEGLGGQVGAAMVVLIDEIDGSLVMSGACSGGSTETEIGGLRVLDLAKRLQDAFRRAAAEHAADNNSVSVDRSDLEIAVSGERPKA